MFFALESIFVYNCNVFLLQVLVLLVQTNIHLGKQEKQGRWNIPIFGYFLFASWRQTTLWSPYSRSLGTGEQANMNRGDGGGIYLVEVM